MTPPCGQVAQLVEQGTENPRVGSSILSLATNNFNKLRKHAFCFLRHVARLRYIAVSEGAMATITRTLSNN